MQIKELYAVSDEPRYQDFFLQGLLAHPACFRISPDEAMEPFPTAGTADSFTLAMEEETTGQLLGVVSFKRAEANRAKLRHRGLLFRMYVDQQAQGKGVGIQLIRALLARVRALGDVRQVNLTVIASNTPARQLYLKLGFIPFALERNAVAHETGYLDEESMALVFTESTPAEFSTIIP
ncbi:GNAT family N-acetyltransferase [Hymenobacter sp. BT664]|uniref:GNAT family N-acetyltransferase n=1 Tax=Hymenobacter montanus TaxID=2771359 RepID=A0A927BAV6_9BACT|nr:GNAT family N-acetyltransferase [Hymenobacter montanus]MBD2766663.1 GNAT family N-acetyltransferase [Hymenobacter montanus]